MQSEDDSVGASSCFFWGIMIQFCVDSKEHS